MTMLLNQNHQKDKQDIFGAGTISVSPINRVLHDKAADRFLYESEDDQDSEIPGIIEPERFVEVPHKHEFDLGKRLVFRFFEEQPADEEEEVRCLLRKSGAYGRFKELLDQRGQVQSRYDYEASATRRAIEEWVYENGIKITAGDSSPGICNRYQKSFKGSMVL